MSSVIETVREPPAFGVGGAGSQYSRPGQDYVRVATVGHADSDSDLWVVVESGQYLVEITYQSGNPGQEGRARLAAGIKHTALQLGEQVVVLMVGGNESHGIIVCALNSLKQPLPETVAGIATGAGDGPQRDDQAPASVFTFVRTRDGQLYALQTGAGADILLHSGAGMEIKADVIHLSGLVHLGASFESPPTPAVIGSQAAGEEGVIAGEPGVAYEPLGRANQTIPTYLGKEDGIVRAKDRYQSNINIDPPAFAYINTQAVYITALEAALTVVLASVALTAVEPALAAALTALQAVPKPGVPPTTLTSAAMSASECTCADMTS